MYIRFVIDELDEDSNQRRGIFQAVYCLKNEGYLYDYELSHVDDVMHWFDDNLASPLDYLNKQKARKADVFISWFKASASNHIAKARELSSLLENRGVVVDQITTTNPGKIVYFDDYQVFAKPYTRF